MTLRGGNRRRMGAISFLFAGRVKRALANDQAQRKFYSCFAFQGMSTMAATPPPVMPLVLTPPVFVVPSAFSL
jgi:hypothetical protein